MQNLRVLIVEAELIISKYLSVSLEEKGFDVIGTPFSIDAAIEEFRNSRPHLMIVDMQLGWAMRNSQSSAEDQIGISDGCSDSFSDNIPRCTGPRRNNRRSVL